MSVENFGGPNEKQSNLYLEQIKGNDAEKYGDLESLINERRLPMIDGKLNIVELGTGGGDTFKRLKEEVQEKDDVRFIGVDNVHLFAKSFSDLTGDNSVVADAGLLPFRDKTISAINASAIFHEISTYGVLRDGNILYGIEAIKKSLEEILRVLAPEGILMYRDVSCPEKRLEYKTVNYRKKAWTLFIERIVPRILESVEISAPEIITGFNMKKKWKYYYYEWHSAISQRDTKALYNIS